MSKSSSSHKKHIIIYPVILAIFPLISLYFENFGLISFFEFLTGVFVVLVLMVTIWVVLRKFLNNNHKSALIVSIFYIMFFSFGHLLKSTANILLKYGIDIRQQVFNLISWKLKTILIVWVLVFLLFLLLISKVRSDFKLITTFMNVTSIALLAITFFRFANDLLDQRILVQEFESSIRGLASSNQGVIDMSVNILETDMPNIYYIILDGYGRNDILQEYYNYNNENIINYLSNRGFYTATDSRSNYSMTIFSLSSSLSMEYLDEVQNQVGLGSTNQLPILYRLRFNRLNRYLDKLGYTSIAFETGYNGTEFAFVDQYKTSRNSLSAFQNELINLTPFSIWLHGFQYYSHHQRILYTFEQLPLVISTDQPTYIFSHIIAPHPPFVFGKNGEFEYQDMEFSLGDGNYFTDIAGQNEYIERYRNELKYINTLLEDTVEKILAKPGRESIIIIQSDHGPGSMLDWESLENSSLEERMSILNSYYFPDQDYSKLYPGITPVNTFRVILDKYLGTDLGLLEDRNYFSLMGKPYDFIDVTEELNKP